MRFLPGGHKTNASRERILHAQRFAGAETDEVAIAR